MEPWQANILTAIVALGTSSGFWAYINTRDRTNKANVRLLLGLAHDRIIFLGMSYVDRGWITKDEYEDFRKYLYDPYTEFGGNGLAEKVYEEVKKLPIRNVNMKGIIYKETDK